VKLPGHRPVIPLFSPIFRALLSSNYIQCYVATSAGVASSNNLRINHRM